MVNRLWSVGTAVLLGAAILVLTVEAIAPRLPPYVGAPDLRQTRVFTFPAAQTLRLENMDGSIRISTQEAAGSSEIAIETDIKLYSLGGSATIGQLHEYLESLFEIRSLRTELGVVTEPLERPETIALQVEYTITVPRGTNIDVSGMNGNVWIAEGCGEVYVHSGNADIEILRPQGTVVARSTNGRIRVVDVEKSTTLVTVNGNIHADLLDGVLEASSTNGTIKTRVLGPEVSGCVLNSMNGAIRVTLVGEASFTVNARAEHGAIRTQIPVDGQRGLLERNQLRGSVGTGETKLNLTTGSGSIWILRG